MKTIPTHTAAMSAIFPLGSDPECGSLSLRALVDVVRMVYPPSVVATGLAVVTLFCLVTSWAETDK